MFRTCFIWLLHLLIVALWSSQTLKRSAVSENAGSRYEMERYNIYLSTTVLLTKIQEDLPNVDIIISVLSFSIF